MDTAEGIVAALSDLDVSYVFGYPGGRVIEVFEALADSSIEVVRARDEREASVMAEMHGRLTREPAVLAGQGPWIGSLGALGQMEARLGSSPMLVLTEASERGEYAQLAPYQQSRGDYGGLSLPKVLDGITKEHWLPRTPAETLRAVGLAYKHAVAGRPGPTAVVLDGDAVGDEVPEDPTPPVWDASAQARTWVSSPVDADVEAAAEALADADRPVVVAGNGVHAAGAYEELEAVAEAYDCAVVTSYLGKSTIPETHDRAAGVIGSFGHEGANQVASEADVLLVVGCRLNPMDTNWQAPSFVRPDDQVIIHADVDPRNAGWVYPADVGLIGDARESLAALAGRVAAGPADGAGGDPGPGGGAGGDPARERGENGGPGDGAGWALQRAAAARENFEVAACSDDAVPIRPQRAATAVESAVGEDTVVTADSGNNRFWLLQYLQTPARRTYFGSGGVGAMGWAPPAAVSAALVTDREAIAVAGDGGFAMTMTAVETAVEYDVAPTFVVFNDTGLGMVRQMDDGIPGTTFPDTDFVRIAEGFGARGVRVDDPDDLEAVLERATEADTPTVVDVRIDPDEPMADQLQSSFYTDVGGLHE